MPTPGGVGLEHHAITKSRAGAPWPPLDAPGLPRLVPRLPGHATEPAGLALGPPVVLRQDSSGKPKKKRANEKKKRGRNKEKTKLHRVEKTIKTIKQYVRIYVRGENIPKEEKQAHTSTCLPSCLRLWRLVNAGTTTTTAPTLPPQHHQHTANTTITNTQHHNHHHHHHRHQQNSTNTTTNTNDNDDNTNATQRSAAQRHTNEHQRQLSPKPRRTNPPSHFPVTRVGVHVRPYPPQQLRVRFLYRLQESGEGWMGG